MKAVLRQTGISADRLRVWERRYGAVRPQRTDNGRRVYRDAEVQRLKLLITLVSRGQAIGAIATLPDDELLRRIGNSKPSAQPHGEDLKTLIHALAGFDLERIRSTLGRIRYSTSPRDFAFQIVPQVMFLVGKKIEQGSFSIAQEHALSEIFQGHLKRIYEDLSVLDGKRDGDGTFLFCTREGDPHDFGLMMAAIACRAAGFKTNYVGKSLPLDALVRTARDLKPRAIVLGVATLPKSEEKISAQTYLSSIHASIDPSVEFWVGGSAAASLKRPAGDRTFFFFSSIEELEEKLGWSGGS